MLLQTLNIALLIFEQFFLTEGLSCLCKFFKSFVLITKENLTIDDDIDIFNDIAMTIDDFISIEYG